MIEKRQQALLREISDAKGHELRFRALHFLVGIYNPQSEAQLGALSATLAELTGPTDLKPLESVLKACENLISAYTPEGDALQTLKPENAELALDTTVNLILPHLHWLHTKGGQFTPETSNPLVAIALSGVKTIGEGRPIIQCGYCHRYIVPKRSSAAWCGPSCKSGAQYRRNRDG